MIIESEENKQPDKLAQEILILSRNTLLVSLRFLDMALSQLKFQKMDEIDTIATDGRFLYYNTWHILNNYKLQKENTVRDYLHVIYHCLFHHPFVNETVHQGCWDLACDIATENAINNLGLNIVINARQGRQSAVINGLKKDLKLMIAEKIYRYYLDQNLSDEQIYSMRQDFFADDHSIWYKPVRQKEHGKVIKSKKGNNGKESEEGNEGSEEGEITDRGETAGNIQMLMDLWKQISERTQVDIETTSRKWGDKKGGLHQGLNQINREKYDYASFLQRFSILGEVMQMNDEEFDLIFYTYGLTLYKNLPLIEPLEYKDVRRIKEFVVAIDTSGSVQGKIVQTFIHKTYNIFKQTENFFTKINIHIIQCDAEVQEDYKITNIEEFEKYIPSLTLRGFGGTDFRPVFRYVDQLIKEKEFENLKGLIYFTDGYGTYPDKKPDYDTAFVFLDEDYVETPDVPSWAIKLVLSTDDVMEGKD